MPSILLIPGTQAIELLDADEYVAYSASGLTMPSKLGSLRAARSHLRSPPSLVSGLQHPHHLLLARRPR